MKTLNNLTIEQLEELSEGTKISYDAVCKLFPNAQLGNTYNHNEVSPNVVQYYFELEDYNFGLISLHIGTDVRAGYTDYYVLDYDTASQIVSDIIHLEVEDQDDIDKLTKWLQDHNPEVLNDYDVIIGDQVRIDRGDYTELMLTPKSNDIYNYINLSN